ncbi:AraC-type DNA-binding protein [Daejeonella rubra]|uniref:AraC-type DNA-binding protein n=1 Tax=Daejeonella rubra TaxID=990371 RepID=A0A1G9QFN4_9SPHI|nr:AraC family transcriptional regulator [Daejeonella rubra]SDM09700.1 AraC-type DNA-binding protein [Daejeonella rubra]
MRLLQTEITPFINNSLHVELRDQAYLFSPLHGRPCYHSHPELELVFIIEGYGKRIIGNKVTQYETGDMVFIGPDVPHLWLSDPVFYKKDSTLRSRVIVMYINPKIFEPMLASVTEFDGLKEMFQQATKGINIFGDTRTIISEKLIALASKTGFEKANGLLEIMHLISISQDRNFIDNKELNAPTGLNSDRLIDVIKFIKDNIHEPISLKQVAEVACMATPSFCRFFKNRTKMRFSQYLVDMRMTHACKLLIELDKPISEIAYMCGYTSNSHFCKVFKDYTCQSPYQYKCSIHKSAS